jgi:hypothetical protein
LRHDRVTAPFVLEGSMNGEMFKAYVEQSLAPTLKRDDIVFMGNVSRLGEAEQSLLEVGALALSAIVGWKCHDQKASQVGATTCKD